MRTSQNFDEKHCCQIALSRYPGAQATMFYGSSAQGTARSTSDIDMLVIVKSPASPFREKFEQAGRIFDVFVYDAESLNGAMILERSAQSMVLINIVAGARIFPPSSALASSIQAAAIRLRNARSTTLELDAARHQITSLIDDIQDYGKEPGADRLMVELYKSIYDLALLSIGCGCFGGKHAARLLGQRNAALAKDLECGLVKALNGDPSSLLDLATTVLRGLGGELRQGYYAPLGAPIRVPLSD